jgi:hypothetical protein
MLCLLLPHPPHNDTFHNIVLLHAMSYVACEPQSTSTGTVNAAILRSLMSTNMSLFVNFCSIYTVLSCLIQENQGTFIQIYSLPVAAVFSVWSTELHTTIGKLQILSDKRHGIKVVIGLMRNDLPWSDRWLKSYKIITLYTDDIFVICEVTVLHIFM